MNVLEAALRRAVDDLEQCGASWALIGGFAVSARAEPRFTRDVDIAVAVNDDAEAEAVVRFMVGSGYGVLATLEHDVTGRLATARLASPAGAGGSVVLDVLFASSGIEPEVVAAAGIVEIGSGLALPVAQTGHLIALKLLARDDERRPQDLSDLRALAAVAGDADFAVAREAVELITLRGFDRDRDLLTALDALVTQ